MNDQPNLFELIGKTKEFDTTKNAQSIEFVHFELWN